MAFVAAVLAGALFVGLALTRRLNFDEALALRAGWLDLAHIPAEPAFLMPWTLFAGAVGHRSPIRERSCVSFAGRWLRA